MKLTSLAIITCWYGDYPWYFHYFIHSCSYNPTVDFLIITDNQETIPNKPDNVKIIHKTLDEIKETASLKLGFEVNLDYAYKLCDFKPAYGFIFHDLLTQYDFWGHADVDLVYGNIREFMTEEILNDNDVISCRHDYTTGTFCLFRNNNMINRLFMESKDYKEVFSSSEHFCFDECCFLFEPLQKGASVFDFPEAKQSMTYVVQKAQNEGKLRAHFDFIIIEGTPGNITWNNGKIIYKDQFEAMYYHLIKLKVDCKKPIILNPIPAVYHFTKKNIKV